MESLCFVLFFFSCLCKRKANIFQFPFAEFSNTLVSGTYCSTSELILFLRIALYTGDSVTIHEIMDNRNMKSDIYFSSFASRYKGTLTLYKNTCAKAYSVCIAYKVSWWQFSKKLLLRISAYWVENSWKFIHAMLAQKTDVSVLPSRANGMKQTVMLEANLVNSKNKFVLCRTPSFIPTIQICHVFS